MPNAKTAVLLIAMLCGPVAAQQARVAGMVRDSVTHQPLPGVHITLRPATNNNDEQPASLWGAISKQDGSFSIGAVPAGSYNLSTRRNGYMQLVSVPLQGGAERFPGPSPLTVEAGENVTDVLIEMTAEVFIAGHVFDENGDPLERFLIEAESARRVGLNGTATRTDERGQFRLVLWPGKFYLKATPLRLPASLPTVERGAAEPVYLATWYPAAQTRAAGAVIEVAPGQQMTDIDFHLTQARTLRISGTVSGMPEAGKDAIVFVQSDASRNFSFPTEPDGKFIFAGLPAGQYRLSARYEGGSKSMQSPISEVRLENADETGVVLTLAPGETVSGMVEIAGGSGKFAGLSKLNVQLFRFRYGDGPLSGLVDSEGRFRIENVFPDKFEVRVLPMPENAYLKSVKVDGADVSDALLDFSRGVNRANLRVTISLNAATLEGRVIAKDGKPAPNHSLVFLGSRPEDIRLDDLKPSGPDGSFRFTGLRPGKYRLLAIDPRLAMAGSEMLKPLFDAASEFEIHEGDRIRKDAEIAVPQLENAKP